MGDPKTGSRTTVSFPNVKVSSLNDDGEPILKFAFKVNITCEYDPEVRNIVIIFRTTKIR